MGQSRRGHFGLLRAVEIVAWIGAVGAVVITILGAAAMTGAFRGGPILLAGDRAGLERDQIETEVATLAARIEGMDLGFQDDDTARALTGLKEALNAADAAIDAADERAEEAGGSSLNVVLFGAAALTPHEGHALASQTCVGAAFLVLFAIFLRRARRDGVFAEGLAGRLSVLGWGVIAWPVLTGLAYAALSLLPKPEDVEGGFEVVIGENVFWGLVLLALAAVFREGARLKREEEMTI